MKRDEYLVQMQATVDEYGLAIQGVGAGDGEPMFAYTVGLARFRQPELIIFGLPMRVAQGLLNDAGLRIVAGTLNLAAGDTVHRLVADYPVRVLTVADSDEHLTVANALYGDDDDPLPALQLVFPDAEGRFPWEPGNQVSGTPLLGPIPLGTGREITLEEK